MKMTMHIDEALLERVMKLHDCASKTEAVDFALRELERRNRLRSYATTGLGLTAAELKDAVDPNYDLMATRTAALKNRHARRRAGR